MPDSSVLDGGRRFLAAKAWRHEKIPCRILPRNLNREEQIRLVLFLNQHAKRKLAVNVGDVEKYVPPIPIELGDMESRLARAREVLDVRLQEDIAFSKIISQQREEFSANYEDVVNSALHTARLLASFARLWDNAPPLPIAAAKKFSSEAVFQLSLCQNSAKDEVLQ